MASAAAHSARAELQAGDDQDWFKLTLAAGTATIKVSSVASDYKCDAELFDATGSKVGEKYQTTPGADCILPVTDLVGGQYFLELHNFSGLPIRGAGGTPVAAFVAQQYKLEVTQ